MKENQIRELVNELRDIAVEYHGTQQLRERIARTVRAAWHHELEKPNQPVSQTYELPQTQFEQVADLYEMQFDDGRTCAFHTDGTKAAQWLLACDGNKVQEYVRIERYQEAVIGNTPVQSPIDHGYRPECECSGCKATARICAELAGSSTVIGIDPASGPDRTVEVHYVAPPGYVMVPNVPTDEMIAAAMNCEDVLFNSDESFCVQFGNIYEAMLAAAPKPQNAPQNIPAGKSTLTPDGWISCSERMPAQDDWVLIYSKHGEYLAGQVQGEYVELNDGTLSWTGSALHWMLLPEPPQQEVK